MRWRAVKRLKFAARSEVFSAKQESLLNEAIAPDLKAPAKKTEQPAPALLSRSQKQQPERQPLPVELPYRVICHEPDRNTCSCGCGCELGCVGEDVAEKLNHAPGVFAVECHGRGKWVCAESETLIQVPVATHIIDKGISTVGRLALAPMVKYAGHLPLVRQKSIIARAGFAVCNACPNARMKAFGTTVCPAD